MSPFLTRGLTALALLLPACVQAQVVSITPAGAFEDFNTLASTGTSSTVPPGWAFFENGSAAPTTYQADNGAGNSGTAYSYGTTGSTDRAFGSLASNANQPKIGAQLRNDTGALMTELDIAYVGEQWRRGDAAEDRLVFEYSIDATSLNTGTWIPFDDLDFVSPYNGTPIGPRDGNAPANQAAIEATLTGLNIAPTGTFWVRWSDINAPLSDDGLAIDDVLFGTAQDVPPILASSVPGDGASNFPNTSNLTLQFSEAVAVSGNWFTLTCGANPPVGVSNSVVSGGPSTYTINPNADLPIGVGCTLSLTAALIQDLTGNTYNGVGSITFTTVAPPPNVPPTVTATSPLNGATTFPASGNLGATFSETVDAAPGAFTLVCASSGNITTLTYPGSGTGFIINTGTALVAGEACTFTIVASAITDNEGAPLAANVVVSFTVTESGASGYYSQVNTSSLSQLRCSLHHTIKGHTAYPYTSGSTDTWDILELADEDPNNSNNILDVYRNASYAKVGGGNNNYNREHTWPKSLGFSSDGLTPHNDTHMLHLSNSTYNTNRNNSPYANCPGCTERVTEVNNGVGGGQGVYPGNSNWFNSSSYEVWNHRKGNMARAVMYMAIRYEGGDNVPDLELTNDRSLIVATGSSAAKAYMGLLDTIIQWHQNDPPDARELDRNEIIQSFQGNRNPFIDHPEWGTRELFLSQSPTLCELNTGTPPPVANDDVYAAVEDIVLTVAANDGVLVNDTLVGGAGTLTAQLVGNAANGVVALAGNGSFTYTPSSNFCGTDGFTYRAINGTAQSAVASVALNVACVNDAPVINNATFSLAENSPAGTVVGTVVATDVDAGDLLTFAITAGNASGAFAIDSNGVITVADAAALDFETTPQFVLQVTVTDNGTPALSDTATVTINLTDVVETPAGEAIFADGFED